MNFYRNSSLGQNLTRRWLSVIMSGLFSLLFELIFRKCTVVQWFVYEQNAGFHFWMLCAFPGPLVLIIWTRFSLAKMSLSALSSDTAKSVHKNIPKKRLSYNLPWAEHVWGSRDENAQKNTEQVKMVNIVDCNLIEFKEMLCSFLGLQ